MPLMNMPIYFLIGIRIMDIGLYGTLSSRNPEHQYVSGAGKTIQ